MEVVKTSLKDFLVARYTFDRRKYDDIMGLCADLSHEIEAFEFNAGACKERRQRLLTELQCINTEMSMLRYIIDQYFPEACESLITKKQFDITKEQFDAYKEAASHGDWSFMCDNPLCTHKDIMYIIEHFDELEEVFGD